VCGRRTRSRSHARSVGCSGVDIAFGNFFSDYFTHFFCFGIAERVTFAECRPNARANDDAGSAQCIPGGLAGSFIGAECVPGCGLSVGLAFG